MLDTPEARAKMAAGEVVLEAFDPLTDPEYLANYEYLSRINEPRSLYWKQYGDPFYAYGYPRLVATPFEKNNATEEQLIVVDNKAEVDSKYYGNKEGSGTKENTKDKEVVETESFKTSADRKTLAPAVTAGVHDLTTHPLNQTIRKTSKYHSADALVACPTVKPSDVGLTTPSQPSTTPLPPTPQTLTTSVEKKNDGKDFMKVKVKYFDRFLSRMNRAPVPKPPRGPDGKELVSRFKQRSNAIKALSNVDDKRLVDFIESQERASNTSGQRQSGTQGNFMAGESGAAAATSKIRAALPNKRAHDGDEKDTSEMGQFHTTYSAKRIRIENSGKTAARSQQQNSSRDYPNISESSGYAGNHNKPQIATDENGYGFPDVQKPQEGAPNENSVFPSGFQDMGYHGAS